MDEADELEEQELGSLLTAMAALASGAVPVGKVAEDSPDFVRVLRQFHPVKLAATFGGLLTQPALQSNCLRLEALVHLSLALGNGTRSATGDALSQGFSAAGGSIGHLEDPAEDVFAGNIASQRGNSLVLEGIWESSTFYLQRFVNLVDELPPFFDKLATSIHALLTLSNIVCLRAGLQRNMIGSGPGPRVLSSNFSRRSRDMRDLVKFTQRELEDAGIDLISLRPFLFDGSSRTALLSESIGHTQLERRPLVLLNDELFLVLPTAVSPAIRRLFLAHMAVGPNRETFLHRLANNYAKEIRYTPMLGPRSPPLRFFHEPWGAMCGLSTRVDDGRYLLLVLVLDALDDFEKDGLAGLAMQGRQLQQEIQRAVSTMQGECSTDSGFRDGVTLVVACGIGRGAVCAPLEERPQWETIFLSAPDFCTLAWTHDWSPLDLWRIIRMRSRLRDMDVHLHNANGFLNLVAWSISLGGHLVPESELPPDAGHGTLHLLIEQNAMLKLRHEVATTWDCHAAEFIDGRWYSIRRDGKSWFEEDLRRPLYAGQIDKQRGLLGACITANRAWWYELASPAEDKSTSSYARWHMLGTWYSRCVQPFEDTFAASLGAGPILWRCVFLEPQTPVEVEQAGGTAERAAQSISVNALAETRTIELVIGPKFDLALFNPENVAEAALVRALMMGVAQLAGGASFDEEALFQQIVPNAEARDSHMFAAQEFRDYIPSLRSTEPTFISRYEDGATKLGMGWEVRDRTLGGQVAGKEECMSFLNRLVRHLEDELCRELRSFNRSSVLTRIISNHEVASASRDHWHRTSSALIALRDDTQAALDSMREHEMKLNAVFQGSRILLEMALCECPVEGGQTLGELDLTLFTAKAAQIYHMGGWSDLMHKDYLEPRLTIQPLGDVHVDHTFIDTVMDGFGNASSEVRFMHSARSYAKRLQIPDVAPQAQGHLDADFLRAWEEEFGVELDAFRRFIDAVENLAVSKELAIITLARSELESLADNTEVGAKIVQAFSLSPRPTWRDVPEGHDQKDISPWRFRRRLSSLRRPLLQLTTTDDPMVIVAPGLLREGFVSIVGNYYFGSYPDRHLGPAMLKYAGQARLRDGMKFNAEVEQKMQDLRWSTHTEIALTRVLGKPLDRNYGDVDVLAWSASKRRILVMECKDLQFRKTHGEIAEQLSDFRGELMTNGKPDLMRRHLNRVDVLRQHHSQVCRFLGVDDDCAIESHLVFRNPVPMQHFSALHSVDCALHTFASLDRLRID